MIVYREQKETVPASEALARVVNAPGPLDRLIGLGELEAAAADALCPDRDGDHPVLEALRRAALRDEPPPPGLPLPATLDISLPEGYAYYALYPETYELAARRYAECERPRRAVVLGIRSIGTSLSAVVARTLAQLGCEVHSWTVRPRGHPFERRLELDPALETRWRELRGAHFAVVDEGPGLSGSSFACVAQRLGCLGVPERRIALFPSWDPDPAVLRNAAARALWRRHPRYLVPFEQLGLFARAHDLSGGNWRADLFSSWRDYPAVQPQHERRKYRRAGVLYKFAGLGRYGARVLERARALAEAGFAPAVRGFERGFLALEWLHGRPVRRGGATSALLETMARYLAFLCREFPCERSVSLSALAGMIRLNTAEGLGEHWAARLHRLEPPAAPACAIDGRMLPHEWLATAGGYLKTDGESHHDDHFFPGPQDPAWDLAAAAIEFDLEDAGAAWLLERYAALSGDRGVAVRLPFYRLAWLAFRLGYADLAARALGAAPDGARFGRLRRRYATRLRREILCHG